ncbi:MAG: iron ABC transporter permease [Myxococcales bacterium]|nr:iron ABC transporter permease [Myxococcales bacterium]
MSLRSDIHALRREPWVALTVAVVFAVLALFVAYPLLRVCVACVTGADGGFTSEHLSRLFTRWHFVRPILNSLLLGSIVAVCGTAVGFLLAFAVTRTNPPLRGTLRRLATLPIIAPPFVIALSAILLFGRNGIVVRDLLLERGGVDLYAHGFDIYGLGGLALVETLSYFPTAFLLLAGVLAAIDPSLEEAAMSLGASRLRTFVKVTLPLAAPGLFASLLLIFIESLADFGNPLILGGRFNVLSVQAYLQITGNDDQAGGSALALVLLVPSLLVYALQAALLERRSFVTVTGKPARLGGVSVSGTGRAVVGVSSALIVGAVVLFYGLVLYGSLVTLWGVDGTLTLSNFKSAFAISRRDVWDSVLLAALSTPVSAIFALVAAYLIERKRFPGRRAMELLSMLTFAVPGTVVGIGYVLAFSRPPLVLTGTAAIIVALLGFRNAPVGMKAASSALKQIDKSLEEAAANLGAPPWRTFARVTLPLLAPALFSSLTYSFVRAMTAVSAVIFVVSGSWNLLTVAILGFVESSELSRAAALSVILVAIVLAVFEGMRLALRRAFPGRFSEV